MSVSPDTPVVESTSGKGGVGKTLVAAGLAVALKRAGARVGVLDIDVRSPNLSLVFGVQRHAETNASYRFFPVYGGPDGAQVPIFSSSFVVPDGLGLTLGGDQVRHVIRDMLADVLWPELEVLVADVDPGPGDSIDEISLRMRRVFAVITSTSDASSLSDCERMINACRGYGTRIVGVVANMVGIVCEDDGEPVVCKKCGRAPHFGDEGPVRDLAVRTGVPFLGALPLSPMFRSDPMRAVATIGRPLFDSIARAVLAEVRP